MDTGYMLAFHARNTCYAAHTPVVPSMSSPWVGIFPTTMVLPEETPSLGHEIRMLVMQDTLMLITQAMD